MVLCVEEAGFPLFDEEERTLEGACEEGRTLGSSLLMAKREDSSTYLEFKSVSGRLSLGLPPPLQLEAKIRVVETKMMPLRFMPKFKRITIDKTMPDTEWFEKVGFYCASDP